MIPVLATKTSLGASPSRSAARPAQSRASSKPRAPVQALALPLLTTTALAFPRRATRRDQVTAADVLHAARRYFDDNYTLAALVLQRQT